MPIRVASFTPLRVRWPHSLCTITRDIQVIEKPTFNENSLPLRNLRRTEEEEALGRSHWLCIESGCEWHERHQMLQRSELTLRNAMLGFQLWAPKGWDGIIIGAQCAGGQLNVETVSCPEPYPMSRWSNLIDIKKLDTDELAPLVEGTLVALESTSVPAKNPFQFLEIGLQTAFNHVRAGALLWTMGLDGLLAAEKQDRFAERLKRLLGENTLVFPEDGVGRRPVYTVGEVAAKMYDLRNLIAHGKEILETYRKPIDFKFEPPELAYLIVKKWTYEMLLQESSLFTLIAALRKVITSGHIATMNDKRAWEKWLDGDAATTTG
jgi:hypothetical protein